MQLTAAEEKLIKEARDAERKQSEEYKIRRAEDYTTEEKVAAFDRFHANAASMYQKLVETRHRDEDEDHYAWQDLMGLLANKEGGSKLFWENYRKLQR